MATVFTEGFDKYGPPRDFSFSFTEPNPTIESLLLQNEWTFINVAPFSSPAFNIVNGLSESGQALLIVGGQSTNQTFISKTLPQSYGTLIGGIRFSTPLACDCGFVFGDGASAQCTFVINRVSGLITLNLGFGLSGTTLATSTIGISANTVHMLEWKIKFAPSGGTPGTWVFYLDGVEIASGTGDTVTTDNDSTNVFQIWPSFNGATIGGGQITVDDIYTFDTTTGYCNTPALTNPRIYTSVPSSDFQAQFTGEANVMGAAYPATFATTTPGANTLFLREFTAQVNCTLNSLSLVARTTNNVAKFKAVIYDATGAGGSPGALIATGTEVIGTVSGNILTAPFSVGQAITGGGNYWIGFITDSAIVIQQQDNTTLLGRVVANTYASGAPSTAPAMSVNQPSWEVWGNCTSPGANWACVSPNPPLNYESYIQSNVLNDEDLYVFPVLPTDVFAIYTTVVKLHCRLQATGIRTVDARIKSGATDSGGANTGIVPTVQWGWFGSSFDIDPNTGAQWSVANLNAAYAGPKVTS